MPLVLGIDEAGYGPLLGPLVVAATLWRANRDRMQTDWWQQLDACVTRRATRSEGRLAVGDSKKLFDRKRGISTLERTVLAFAHAADLPCATLTEFLTAIGHELPSEAGLPWYGDLTQSLPTDPARSAYEGAARRTRETMASCGISCLGARTQLITEDVFNRRVRQTRNKAAVLLEAVLRLVQWGTQHAGDQDVHIFVDRLGGRVNYREVLMQAFPGRHLHVVEVGEGRSRYRLASQESDWLLEFVVHGDQRHLPVALASMLAKYVRELLMERFNAYWNERAPKLRPTAGYYSDAKRFLSDIAPLLEHETIRTEDFVRLR